MRPRRRQGAARFPAESNLPNWHPSPALARGGRAPPLRNPISNTAGPDCLPVAVRHPICHYPHVRVSRLQSDDSDSGRYGQEADSSGVGPTRFNLLLSCAGWRPDPWVERFPRLLEPMGIASHTARCGKEASALIKSIPIHLAVVDLAIPLDGRGDAMTDDAGIRLLELLARLDSPPPTVVIKRGLGGRDDCREMTAALRAGAFSVVDRPKGVDDLEIMLEVLRRALVRFYKGRWPGGTGVVPPNFA